MTSPQATCGLDMLHGKPYTNQNEIFFCILYLKISDFSWLKILFPVHYPTKLGPAKKAKPVKAGSHNLHYHIAKWLECRKNLSSAVTWTPDILNLWSYILKRWYQTEGSYWIWLVVAATVYDKTLRRKTFVVFTVFHLITNLFLWIMALSISNISVQKYYSKNFTVN